MVVLALGLAFGTRTFAFAVFFVPSGSMEPTLQPGDRIVVDKLLFDYHHPSEGAVVVFHRPAADTPGICAGGDPPFLVKRVIGLPGETIASVGDRIEVDGHLLKERYLPASDPLGRLIATERIPPGRYFVMGDNRALSCDSRYWGTIAGSSIVGTVDAVVWRHGRPVVDSV
ncbi:MAG: signal peptidase [Acidimicrobiaceae bacterium]|nr:signal peptidase [Acidimicrobiaceae bacterium]